MVTKGKLLKLAEMEAIAKEATHNALSRCAPPSAEDKKQMTLGKVLTNEAGVFELYVPADKPHDAKVISRATVDRVTGKVTVEVFLPPLSE
jgi:hypothetical protein